jgi:hypothetical protein
MNYRWQYGMETGGIPPAKEMIANIQVLGIIIESARAA